MRENYLVLSIKIWSGLFHRKIASPVTVPCDFKEARKLPSLTTSMGSLNAKFPGKGAWKEEVVEDGRGGWSHAEKGTEGEFQRLASLSRNSCLWANGSNAVLQVLAFP